VVTDRGYDMLRNLEKYILRGQSMVTSVKTGQNEVAHVIRGLGEFGGRPDGMTVDSDVRIYYKQYDIDYKVESIGQAVKASDRLKLNLYFDPIRRGLELMELDIALSFQEAALNELLENESALGDDATIRRDYNYYKVVYDDTTRVIKSFKLNEKKVAKARSFSGFFSIMTRGVDFDAMKAYHTYRLRDEQEKFFQQMKEQMVADR
jgi:hypothetical protein